MGVLEIVLIVLASAGELFIRISGLVCYTDYLERRGYENNRLIWETRRSAARATAGGLLYVVGRLLWQLPRVPKALFRGGRRMLTDAEIPVPRILPSAQSEISAGQLSHAKQLMREGGLSHPSTIKVRELIERWDDNE